MTAKMMPTMTATSRSRIGGAPLEAEPDAAHRDHPGRGAALLELLAQPADGGVEGLGRPEPVLVPDLVHEALAGDDGTGLGVEHGQDVELLGRHDQLCLADPDPASADVDAQAV